MASSVRKTHLPFLRKSFVVLAACPCVWYWKGIASLPFFRRLMSASFPPVQVRKAIFPVAGIGSRFLPLTLAVPKEMIPIIDTPLLHFAVAEALDAGIEECVFVVAPERGQRRVIEDYFCDNGALEKRLASAGKGAEAARWRGVLPRPKRVRFVEQAAPLGLGHAIFSARECVGEEPFAVLLADELLRGVPGCLASLASAFSGVEGEVLLAMQEVAPEDCRRYGILDLGPARRNTFFSRPQSHPDLSGISPRRGSSALAENPLSDPQSHLDSGETSPRRESIITAENPSVGSQSHLDSSETSPRRESILTAKNPSAHPQSRPDSSETSPLPQAVRGVVEKPATGAAPSRMAIIGRYILPPSIFPLLQPRGELRGGEETPLTDALGALMARGAPCYGLRFDGERYDCGSKEGFLAATFAFAREQQGGGGR